MRLSDEEIKRSLLHPDWEIRNMALGFFQKSLTTDQTVMPVLIEAIEKYGWDEACWPSELHRPLKQTEETVRWVLKQLDRPCPDPDRDRLWKCWLRFLSRQLDGAAAELLMPHAGILDGLAGLDVECRSNIQQRLAMASMDARTGWRELATFGEQSADEYFDFEMAGDELAPFLEVIARGGEQFTEQILETLASANIDDPNSPDFWTLVAATHLAGLLRLNAAVPLIFVRMEDELDNENYWFGNWCADALIRIGSDDVIQNLSQRYGESDSPDFRSMGARILEGVRSDRAVETGLELIANEADDSLREYLADSLLFQFDARVIEPIRVLILKGQCDDFEELLIRRLVAVSTVLGASLPEFAPWQERAARSAAIDRVSREDALDPEGRTPDDWEAEFDEMEREYGAFDDYDDDDEDLDEFDDDDFDEPIGGPFAEEEDPPSTIIYTGPTVGRNDPCPCGSGKKFKKCCMNRERNPPPIEW